MGRSNIAITMIRTGHGDKGDTKLGGKPYRKGHPVVLYSAALDIAQSHTDALPEKWGDYAPRDVAQEMLFRLGAIGGHKPKDQELPIVELSKYMEEQLEYVSGSLEPLDSFIRCAEQNSSLQRLRAALREAECRAVAARDHLELESRDTSPTMIYMLEAASKALNIMSDWVFAFVWAYSVNELGKLDKTMKWLPWADEKFTTLNLH